MYCRRFFVELSELQVAQELVTNPVSLRTYTRNHTRNIYIMIERKLVAMTL